MLKVKAKKSRRSKWATALMAAVITVSAVSLPGNKVEAATATGPKDAKEVEAFADAYFNRPEVKKAMAGAAFVVVDNDKVLLNKGFGYADVESKQPVIPNETVFRVASVSKVFTATGVMQLVEEGKIDLEADIHNYTGDLKIANQTNSKLTMKDVLTHTTGFDYTDITTPESYSLEQHIKEFAPTVVRKPGAAYRYDNYASDLQGYIMQQVEDQPFEQLIDEKIFRPLGMENSDFRMSEKMKEKLATGYTATKEPHPDYEVYPTIMPSGGMFSTSTDISKFMFAHLNGGKFGNERILKEDTVKDMHKTRISSHPELPNMTYGFEMFYRESFNGEYVIAKGGDLPGYHSWMWMLPDRKVGGFVVLNSDVDSTPIISGLFKAFMDHYYPKTNEELPALKLTKEQLARFEGSYRFLRFPFIYFDVKAEDGYLLLNGTKSNVKLEPIGDMLFKDEAGMLAAFKTDETGNIVYLDYYLPSAWSEKVESKPDYSDVPRNHPYANAIYTLRTLDGVLHPDAITFEPEKALTRAEFATELFRFMGNKPITTATTFVDTEGHRYSNEIHQLATLGIILGSSAQRFSPDQLITREEAAVMIYRLMQSFGASAIEVELSGETSPWAEEAAQFLVATGMAGPTILPKEGGADFRSKEQLLHKESAFMLSNVARVLAMALGI
ncbi:serine hydrolase [Paenibacillus sp. GSMTC-2017]|uniref:serine hydrolase n=1 Tax=Paenibacillus sp. GSMTC-2017 TaxID=2794350 RepID=UPI0018D8E51E|nr:serine hydrolase [Paenibacillus sp. GSMTC-2017]MBH5320358.1 serine hydrolase [Paenibacillus sp. GSMTC-2017]